MDHRTPTDNDIRFTAMCYEYLGDGKFTADYRMMGFARALFRLYGGSPEQICVRLGNAANDENMGNKDD
jgi:hypothetical protein